MSKNLFSRRTFMASTLASTLSAYVLSKTSPLFANPDQAQIITRKIPKTGEDIPVIGMGTWITFNVGNDAKERDQRVKVLDTFFKAGGGMIDSSPMYGSAEEVVGYCLSKLGKQPSMFSATKVWTPLSLYGKLQIKNSHQLWGVEKFDLFQVHNLVSWETHLETLLQMKADGKLRYVGITTSHGLRHPEFEKIMASQPIDFVQFTYNVLDREAEDRLLPLAQEKKIAVIINRPFQRGALFDRFEKKPLPNWISEFDCENWAQFFLKYVISHPAVTVAIPATSQVNHMTENMGAARGRLPDESMRTRMIDYIREL